jgi:hypothetical protein
MPSDQPSSSASRTTVPEKAKSKRARRVNGTAFIVLSGVETGENGYLSAMTVRVNQLGAAFEQAVVVIPAHNEAALLPRCLADHIGTASTALADQSWCHSVLPTRQGIATKPLSQH